MYRRVVLYALVGWLMCNAIMSESTNDVRSTRSQRGARNQQVARAGEYFVAAELNKRGAFAVTFAGNMPKIDLMACNQN